MTFSYIDPLTRVQDAVRFEIGDTIESRYLVEDADILYALSLEGTVLKAAARMCEHLAARFARDDNFRGSTLQTSKQTVTEKYKKMAASLRRRGLRAGSFIIPSISQSQKQLNDLDSDAVQGAFSRGMHDNTDTALDSGPEDVT